MPNRVIRDVGLTSRKLAAASDFGERLYWRLYQAVDDFGRFYGDPAIIRARCCPLMLDHKSESDVRIARDHLASLGLIVLYRAGTEEVVQITKWEQRVRANKSRFPSPDDSHVTVIRPSSAGPYEDRGTGIEELGAGGDTLAECLACPPPPPPAEHPAETATSRPRPGLNCPDCTVLLQLLADVGVVFGSLGPGGAAEVHAAHEVAGTARAVTAIRGQIDKWRRQEIPQRFLAPAVLFKPKCWQVTVNAVHDRPPVERAERV